MLEKHIMEHHLGLSAFYEVCLVCKQEFFTHAEYINHHHGNGDYSREKQFRLSEEEIKPMTDVSKNMIYVYILFLYFLNVPILPT